MSRWPVAGPSEYRLLASSPASKVKNSNAHIVQQIHIRWQQYTQENYNNTHKTTNNNYTQDNLKLTTIHTRHYSTTCTEGRNTQVREYCVQLSSKIDLPRSSVFMSVFRRTFVGTSYDVHLIYAHRTQQNVWSLHLVLSVTRLTSGSDPALCRTGLPKAWPRVFFC